LTGAADQGSRCRDRCTSSAARTASLAEWKAAEKESPIIWNTDPLCASIVSRRIWLCRASRAGMASGCCCESLVLPSISVNRKVTVPAGKSVMISLQYICYGLLRRHGSPHCPEHVELCL